VPRKGEFETQGGIGVGVVEEARFGSVIPPWRAFNLARLFLTRYRGAPLFQHHLQNLQLRICSVSESVALIHNAFAKPGR
jgi:hypothetical protein